MDFLADRVTDQPAASVGDPIDATSARVDLPLHTKAVLGHPLEEDKGQEPLGQGAHALINRTR